jgi:hypothetical protein
VNLQYLFDSAIDIVFARRLAMEDLDREGPTRNGEIRRFAEEVGELDRYALSVDRIEPSHHRLLTFSAFMVADVTISLRSLRRVRTVGVGVQRESTSSSA